MVDRLWDWYYKLCWCLGQKQRQKKQQERASVEARVSRARDDGRLDAYTETLAEFAPPEIVRLALDLKGL